MLLRSEKVPSAARDCQCTVKLFWLCAIPLDVTTVMGPVVAPGGTVAVMKLGVQAPQEED